MRKSQPKAMDRRCSPTSVADVSTQFSSSSHKSRSGSIPRKLCIPEPEPVNGVTLAPRPSPMDPSPLHLGPPVLGLSQGDFDALFESLNDPLFHLSAIVSVGPHPFSPYGPSAAENDWDSRCSLDELLDDEIYCDWSTLPDCLEVSSSELTSTTDQYADQSNTSGGYKDFTWLGRGSGITSSEAEFQVRISSNKKTKVPSQKEATGTWKPFG